MSLARAKRAAGGQAADCTQALTLLEGVKAEAVLAEKGDDTDYIIDAVQGIGDTVVIPPKSHRKTPRTYDEALYKERHIVERMCKKLKHFRSIATRYGTLAASFMAWLNIAAITLWLRSMSQNLAFRHSGRDRPIPLERLGDRLDTSGCRDERSPGSRPR